MTCERHKTVKADTVRASAPSPCRANDDAEATASLQKPGKSRDALRWWDVATCVTLAAALGARAQAGSVWDIAKIAVVFTMMIALIRRGVSVGIVLIVSAPILGRLFDLAWNTLGSVMTFGLFDSEAHGLHQGGSKAVGLGAVILLVTTLGRLLVDSGAIRRFVEAVEALLGDVRWIAATVPAVIGLLPMPGGAMLSAPMVGELSDRLEMDAETKTLANYWFRHVWEFSWFIYPGLITASTLVNDWELSRLMVAHAPLTLAAIAIGVFAILLPVRKREHIARPTRKKAGAIVSALWPVAAIVAAVAAFGHHVGGSGRIYLMAGVTLVVAVVFAALQRMKPMAVLAAAKRSVSLELALLVVGIYLMQSMFATSHAADALPAHFARMRIPTAVILFFVPMMVGLLTGITVAAVATTFPLLLGLIDESARNIMLAYAGGYLGVLLSPVHLCLVLTRDYFQASWRVLYGRLLLCVGMLAAFAYGLYLVYGLNGG